MTPNTYKLALRQAKNDLANAMRQRDYCNLEIGRLQQLVKSLSASIERKSSPAAEKEQKKISLSALVGVRFTDMVQSIVNSSENAGMSAADVKKALEQRGYDLSEYSNPSALIHQTLKRLAKDGRVESIGNGKYRMDAMGYILSGWSRAIKRDSLKKGEK